MARALDGLRGPAAPGGPLLNDRARHPGSANETVDRNDRPETGERGRPRRTGGGLDLAEGTILQGGRRKAYRPLDPETRREALGAALAAYERGDFFEAHELLEPAWMGTDDPAERALYQGLIKLAAGYVHWVRGNARGMLQNLEGARRYLEEARAGIGAAAVPVDLAGIIAAIDLRIEILRAMPPSPARPSGTPRFLPHDPVRDVPDAPRLR